jgi:hypothetical protein
MQIAAQPRARCFDGEVFNRNGFAGNLHYRATCQIDADRGNNAAAAEGWICPATTQQGLVDVVVQNVPEVPAIFLAESPRQVLSKRIANRVRMSETFTFDDLDAVLIDGSDWIEDQIHRRVVDQLALTLICRLLDA